MPVKNRVRKHFLQNNLIGGRNPPTTTKGCLKMETHDQLTIELEQYKIENEKFQAGNKSAGVRARKHLNDLMKLCKTRRGEIQDEKEWIVKQ